MSFNLDTSIVGSGTPLDRTKQVENKTNAKNHFYVGW